MRSLHIGFAATLSIVSVLPAWSAVICLDSPDHLEPVSSILSSSEVTFPYLSKVRSVLLRSEIPTPYFRMTVIPSFSPEWVITVSAPTGNEATVRVVDASRQIWADGKLTSAKVIISEMTVPRATAEALRSIADVMLLSTSPCREPDAGIGVDGNTYEFSAFFINRGVLTGEIWSPKDGTRGRSLVEVAALLGNIVRAPSDRRSDMLSELNDRLAALRKIVLLQGTGP